MRRTVRILISCCSALVVTLIIGWGVLQLGRLYLGVLGQHAVVQNSNSTGSNRQVLRLAGFQVWYLQYGLFASQESAEKAAKQLEQKGVKTVVLRGQPFRVVSGYFGQQQAAKAERLLIGLKGVQPLQKSLNVNGISFKIASGNAEQVKTLLVNYGQILSAASGSFTAAEPAELTNLNQLVEQVKKLRAETSEPVKNLVTYQSRENVREVTLSLDRQGKLLEDNLELFLKDKTREHYQQVQISLLQLLNTYWQCLELLQK